jgi:hypothetical protein
MPMYFSFKAYTWYITFTTHVFSVRAKTTTKETKNRINIFGSQQENTVVGYAK